MMAVTSKPRASDPVAVWSLHGQEAGQESAQQERLSSDAFAMRYTLDYLAAAQATWLRRNGVKKLSVERREAFAQSFRLSFARSILARTSTVAFVVRVGVKNIRLLPSVNSPTWTVAYLDARLDQQSLSGVLDPFAAIQDLQARDWPAQPQKKERN